MHKHILFLLAGLFIATGAASSLAADFDPGCPRDGVLDHPNETTPHFSYKNESPYVPCDDSNLGYKMRRSYQYLVDLPEDFDGKNPYSPSVLDNSPLAFVGDNAERIMIIGVPDPECEFGAAFVKPSQPTFIYVCPDANKGTILQGAALLTHEARHIFGAATGQHGFPHIVCTNPRLSYPAPGAACDAKIENAGAYTTQFQFFLGVSHLEQISASSRDEARALALTTLFENFDGITGFTQGAVLIRESGLMEFWDGNTTHTMLEQVPAELRLLHEPLSIVFSHPSYVYPAGYHYDHTPARFKEPSGALDAVKDRIIANKIRFELHDDSFIGTDLNSDRSHAWAKPKNTDTDTFLTFNKQWVNPNGPSEEHAYVRFTNGGSIELQSTFEKFKKEKKWQNPAANMHELISKFHFLGQVPAASPFAGQLMALEIKTGQLKIMPKGVTLPGPRDDVQTEPSSISDPIKQMNSPISWDESLDVL